MTPIISVPIAIATFISENAPYIYALVGAKILFDFYREEKK